MSDRSVASYAGLSAHLATFSISYMCHAQCSNRKLASRNVPSSREAWKPYVPLRKLLVEREEELRLKEKVNFDWHQRPQDLLPALPGDLVWIPDRREQGTVGDEMTPQSYIVETPSSTFRRNRGDIIHLPTEDI